MWRGSLVKEKRRFSCRVSMLIPDCSCSSTRPSLVYLIVVPFETEMKFKLEDVYHISVPVSFSGFI